MIKLISLDLDGTLLTPEGKISQASKAAIAQARQAGVRVVLNTGRCSQEAMWISQEAGCDNLACALGGASLVDGQRQQVLRRWDMPKESGRTAMELCLGKGIELMIFAGDAVLLDPFSKKSLLQVYPHSKFFDLAVETEHPLAYMEAHDLPLTKLHGDWNQERYPLKELSALPGVALTCSNDHDFELVPAGADKGSTLATLALMYGVALEDCAAIGDSENDLPMLQAVGTPIAMGNAADVVKQTAKYLTQSNGEDGAAQAILRCLGEWS